MLLKKSILIIILIISLIYAVLQYLFIPSSIDRIIGLIIWYIALTITYLTYFLYFCSSCRGLKMISLTMFPQFYKILEKFLTFSTELSVVGLSMENVFMRVLGHNIVIMLISSSLVFMIWFFMQKLLPRSIRLLIEIILFMVTYILAPSLAYELKGLEERFGLIEVAFNAIG